MNKISKMLILSIIRVDTIDELLMGLLWLVLTLAFDVFEYTQQITFSPFPCVYPISLCMSFLAIIWILHTISILRNPAKHRVITRLKKLGALEQIMDQIIKESEAPLLEINNVRIRGELGREKGRLLLTDSFGIAISRSQFNIVQLEDVLWVYPYHYTYGSVLRIADSTGMELEIGTSSGEYSKITKWIYVRLPWIIKGSNKDISRKWIHNRQALVDIVQSRRQNLSQTTETVTEDPTGSN